MNRAYITKELLTEHGKQLALYYSENLDMYVTENFAIRAGYCDVENGIKIKDMKECLNFSEDYIAEIIDTLYYDSWDTINVAKHNNNAYVKLHNSISYVEIHDKYFQNIIKPLNCDISLPYLFKDKPIQMVLDDLVLAIIMPSIFEVFDNSGMDIYENMHNEEIPNDIKENFIFDYVLPYFISDNAMVKFDNYCGELDGKGELISKFKCDKLSCTELYNCITINNKQAIIDKNGNFIIKPIYDEISYFRDNLWMVAKEDKYGVVDNNNIIWDFKYDSIDSLHWDNKKFIVAEKGKFGIIDIQKNIIVPLIYDNLKQDYYNDNLLFAVKNSKYGMIGTDNKTIIPFKYEELSEIGTNNLIAKITEDNFIIINKQNKQLCKTVFQDIEPYCFNKNKDEQLYLAKSNDLYGFIDEFGNVKIDFKYLYAENFRNGYCLVVTKDNTTRLIDKNDNIIISNLNYESFISAIDNDRIIVRNFDGYIGIIDTNKNIICDFIFSNIDFYEFAEEKFYRAICNGKYGFIDKNGNVLKINKESLKIPETKLKIETLSQVDQMKYLFL